MVTVPVLEDHAADGTVRLRAHREEDVDRIVEQCRDPQSVRWTIVPSPYSRDDAHEFVRRVMPGGWASDREWGFAVEYQGRFAGTVTLRNHDEHRAEVAYGAHPDVRGTGAMERALRLLLPWGFASSAQGGRDLETVLWLANEGNWASRKLAWRVGFSFDGTLRGWLPHRGDLVDAWTGTLRREEPLLPRNRWLDVPRILGERVVLRAHRPGDVDRVLSGCRDRRTSYWLGLLPDPYTRADAERFLRLRSMGMAAGTDLHWALADPESDELTGVLSLMRVDGWSAEIGYWAHPRARGHGVMTEALRLAVRHAFVDTSDGGLGLHRVYLYVAVDNAASRHVAEEAGLSLEGELGRATLVRDGLHDAVLYARLR